MIELLAPAGNAAIAISAIKHGADAVYIGPPSHGARKGAANSLEDIRKVTEFAHIYGAKVYVTLNTLILENELKAVERMIRDLYLIEVDALIIQDMGILRMDIPPIPLHASTQCDIRTPRKAKFLQEAGFSQLVLARELSLAEIAAIRKAVDIPLESFIHGALCVSYSGRCSAGYVCAGRSGNRGECPQICRQSFTLRDAEGKILAKDKYLLSLKDFRAEPYLKDLIAAGVTSFKIEGRLKEEGYVKNVTAAYSRKLNEIVADSDGKLRRASAGTIKYEFTPDLEKSFNRGFSTYMLSGRPDNKGIAAIHTPKSVGERIKDITDLKPGDGISFFDKYGKFTGVLVNGVKNGKIISNRPINIPYGTEIRRTLSAEWKKKMAGETARRLLGIDITMDGKGVTAKEETGAMARIPYNCFPEKALKEPDYEKVFGKLGNTHFFLKSFINNAGNLFFPISKLAELRRSLIENIMTDKRTIYRFGYRRPENLSYPYPEKRLDYRDNVANSLAEKFYRDHGVKEIKQALETGKYPDGNRKRIIMTSRHCILRELGLCLKHNKIKMPLSLTSGNMKFKPEFNCRTCEMTISE